MAGLGSSGGDASNNFNVYCRDNCLIVNSQKESEKKRLGNGGARKNVYDRRETNTTAINIETVYAAKGNKHFEVYGLLMGFEIIVIQIQFSEWNARQMLAVSRGATRFGQLRGITGWTSEYYSERKLLSRQTVNWCASATVSLTSNKKLLKFSVHAVLATRADRTISLSMPCWFN